MAFWSVVALGVVPGALSMWFMRRWSNAGQLRTALNRIWAHLLEFRLFADEPRMLLRAQRGLLVANGRMLRMLVVPTLILSVPYAALLVAGDALFGRASLRVGKTSVVTFRFNDSPLTSEVPRLEAPRGIQVETPPVRIPAESSVSWRIRADRPSSGEFKVIYGGRVFTKPIEVRYPPATVFHLHWLVWFSLASILGAGISGLWRIP